MLPADVILERLLVLLRHPDADLVAQGLELLQALPPALRHPLLRGQALCHIDLSGADLSGMDLSNTQLNHTSLAGCDLRGACLDGADLRQARLDGADLSGASVQWAGLSDSRLHNARLHGTNLSRSQLVRAEFESADLQDADLSRTDLRGASFSRARVVGCRLTHALIQGEQIAPYRLPALAWGDTAPLNASAGLAGMDLSDRRLGELLGNDLDLSGIHLTGSRIDNVQIRRARLVGADLRRARLDGAVLAQSDLTDADLRDVHLTAADLTGVILDRAQLTGAHLDRAVLHDTALEALDLSGASLRGCALQRRRLPRRLRGVDLRQAHLNGADLSGADLSGANLSGAHLNTASLSGADLSGASLGDAILTGADLSGADLSGVELTEGHLKGARLEGARLDRARLDHARLAAACLRDASLVGAALGGTVLRAADLSGADLSGADLSGAHLQEARLVGARLGGVRLARAGLQGANLTDAVGLTSAAGAFVDAHTRLPPGVDGGLWLGPGAVLRGADLRGVWMHGVDLAGADLTGADLREATLSRADLRGADLTGAQLEGARLGLCRSSDDTRWPSSLPSRARPTPEAVLHPVPLRSTPEALARHHLHAADPVLAREARLLLARLGHGAEALALGIAACAPVADLLALAAHCPPEALPPDAQAVARLASQAVWQPLPALIGQVLHPERVEAPRPQVRAVHNAVLGELFAPERAEVVAGLRARAGSVTLGGRALRRLRNMAGLRDIAPDALEAIVRACLLRGPAEARRALVRILPQTTRAGDADVLFLASVEDASVRGALLERLADPAATHAWIRQKVCEPEIDSNLRCNLLLRLPHGPARRALTLHLAERDLWLLNLISAEPEPEPELIVLLQRYLDSPEVWRRCQGVNACQLVVLRHAAAREALLPTLQTIWTQRTQHPAPANAVEPLLQAIQEVEPARQEALAAIGFVAPYWQQRTVEALLQSAASPPPVPLPPTGLGNLLERLSPRSPAHREALRWSSQHPEQAAAVLLAGLRDASTRLLCLQHLRRLSRIRSGLFPVAALVPLLRGGQRRLAAALLGELGDDAVLPALYRLAERGNAGDQAAALRAIGQLLLTRPRPVPR